MREHKMHAPTVREWLTAAGLLQYLELFEQNRLGLDVVSELTERDLQDLGIPLGDRKRLLKAIQSLGQVQCSDATGPRLTGAPDAERRQLTVMFCDLVGSTALSSSLDPEDLRAVIAAYHRQATEVIRARGGFVAQYMGDGVLAYFGYPQAHEDDAERAVQAALSLVDAIARVPLSPTLFGSEREETPSPARGGSSEGRLQARVGIATGLVVVGDVSNDGAAQEQAVVGETPNLAARLQTLAEP